MSSCSGGEVMHIRTGGEYRINCRSALLRQGVALPGTQPLSGMLKSQCIQRGSTHGLARGPVWHECRRLRRWPPSTARAG